MAYGWVSYDYSYAFVVKGTDPDTVGFTLMVRPSTFERFAKRIVEGSVDTISLVVGIVDGFYATWSPVDVRTSEVKVLARGKEQVIEDPTGSGIEPPRLGKIYDANIYFIAKRELPVRGAC